MCACNRHNQKDFAPGIGEVRHMGKYLFRKLTLNIWVTAIVVLQLALALVLLSHSLSVNSNYTMSVSQVENIYGM